MTRTAVLFCQDDKCLPVAQMHSNIADSVLPISYVACRQLGRDAWRR
jgi:hypothetical protein